MRSILKLILLAGLPTALLAMDQAPVKERKALTLEGARQAIAAAQEYARRNNAPGAAIAVVDEGGNLIAVERLDGTFAAGPNISIGKARTAALFQRPTATFENIIRQGRTPMLALNDFTPLQGGVPIQVEGQTVGAIGVSGAASAQQDEEIALAGAAALSGASPAAASQQSLYFDGKRVSEAFAKGAPLLETAGYKVHASRREKPGLAEVHNFETDIFLVLEGTATFVTGGEVMDGQVTEAGQIRGQSITGGQSRQLKKGDAVVVPAGVPHQFTAVEGPFLYFVVKPISH